MALQRAWLMVKSHRVQTTNDQLVAGFWLFSSAAINALALQRAVYTKYRQTAIIPSHKMSDEWERKSSVNFSPKCSIPFEVHVYFTHTQSIVISECVANLFNSNQTYKVNSLKYASQYIAYLTVFLCFFFTGIVTPGGTVVSGGELRDRHRMGRGGRGEDDAKSVENISSRGGGGALPSRQSLLDLVSGKLTGRHTPTHHYYHHQQQQV